MKMTKKELKKMIEECMGDMMAGKPPKMPMQGQMSPSISAGSPFPGGEIVLSLGGEEEESYDADGRMARGNVYNLMKHASMLSALIKDGDDLEPWVQEKIAVATEAIETVAEYLEYEKTRGGHD